MLEPSCELVEYWEAAQLIPGNKVHFRLASLGFKLPFGLESRLSGNTPGGLKGMRASRGREALRFHSHRSHLETWTSWTFSECRVECFDLGCSQNSKNLHPGQVTKLLPPTKAVADMLEFQGHIIVAPASV